MLNTIGGSIIYVSNQKSSKILYTKTLDLKSSLICNLEIMKWIRLHQKNYNSTLSLVEPNRELLKIDEEINRAKTKIGTDTDVCFIQMILNQPITNHYYAIH